MKRYSEYKDSGVQWIGKIPSHWKHYRNKDIFVESKNVVGEESYKYTLLSLTKQGVIVRDLTENKGKFPKEYNTYKKVEAKDMIFCLFDVDETPRTVGLSTHRGMITGAYDIFKINRAIPEYLLYYYLSVDDRKALRPIYKGLRKVVPMPSFMSLPIFLPPNSEQQAIVDYLKVKTSKIEQYVTERERELLESLKQSEIANVVTHGLNPDVPMKDSGIPWIGMIPEHWKTRKIKFLFKERSQKGFPNEPILCATQKYGVIPQNMYENRVVVVNKGLEGLKLVKKGDFVISLRSFQGGIEYAHYQGIISAAYTVLIPSKDINSQYIKFLFKSAPFIGLLQTCVTGIREGQNINYDVLRKNQIMLPPLDEQQAIVDYIEARLTKIDNYIADLQAEIDYLKEFKQRLVSDVVTGQICVAEPQKGDLR